MFLPVNQEHVVLLSNMEHRMLHLLPKAKHLVMRLLTILSGQHFTLERLHCTISRESSRIKYKAELYSVCCVPPMKQ